MKRLAISHKNTMQTRPNRPVEELMAGLQKKLHEKMESQSQERKEMASKKKKSFLGKDEKWVKTQGGAHSKKVNPKRVAQMSRRELEIYRTNRASRKANSKIK